MINAGKLSHEFVLGTKKELDEHAAIMKKFPNMKHDELHMAHVEPGKRWTSFGHSTEQANLTSLVCCLVITKLACEAE